MMSCHEKQTEGHNLENKGGTLGYWFKFMTHPFIEAEHFIESETRHLSIQPVSHKYDLYNDSNEQSLYL